MTREDVIQAVADRLKDKPWYRGVCTTNITQSFYTYTEFQAKVNEVEIETRLWDEPGFTIAKAHIECNCGIHGKLRGEKKL